MANCKAVASSVTGLPGVSKRRKEYTANKAFQTFKGAFQS